MSTSTIKQIHNIALQCNCDDPVRSVEFTDGNTLWCRVFGNPDTGNLVSLVRVRKGAAPLNEHTHWEDDKICDCSSNWRYSCEISKL